jgi:predicted regulator of Ras-like GTPase activity (Roadblock/LC7/MglB family)
MSEAAMDSVEQKEAEAYGIFKTLRNRLRKFRPEEVVHYCIRQLNPGRSFEWAEVMRRPPWLLLLLIKWTAVNGDFLPPNRRALSERDTEEIIAMLHEIWGKDLPSCYENLYLFFRARFQQQYWLQELFLVPEMSRQYILFLDLDPEHRFSATFLEVHGIELNTFLELSVALISRFAVSESYTVDERFFENLTPSYPPGTIPTFLSILSRDLEALGRELSTMPKHGVLHEVSEPTPLLRFPLLKENSRYHCYLVHLLFRTVQNFVYDTLRAADAQAFTNKFGPIFERYLEHGLSHASLEYITESELKNKLPHHSKVVDFTVLSEDAAVLIDAKAIQLTDLGMLARTSATLAGKASTALKAVDQGFTVAANLKKIGLVKATCSLFLLVVTYKDLLLGSCREFYENVAKESIDSFAAAHGDIHPIPVDHIFFLSINDFDLLMEHLKASGTRLADFLHKAVQDNSDPRTASFVFRTHIPEVLGNPSYPEYLLAEFANSGQRLQARLMP